MKIGIDGLILRGRDAGSLRYFELLLDCLASAEHFSGSASKEIFAARDHTPVEYVIFANRRLLESTSLPQPGFFTFQEVADHHFLPAALRQQLYTQWHASGKLDLLHTPVFVPPLAYPGKTILTLFDLTFLLHPQTQKWTGRFWWRVLGARGIKKAERVITISHSTRRDLCQYLAVPEEKVNVIYPFVSKQFHPLPRSTSLAERQAIIARYHLPEKYILCVGTLERRKNIPSLLKAFAQARQAGRLEHCLVLVGQPGWLYQDIFRTIDALDLQKSVFLPGYIPDTDLPGIYRAADLFAFLSDYEGFGFPVLEAMACGVPVLTSNVSSMPEIVGQAGIMVPPHAIDQAAAEILHILTNQDLHMDMIQRGLERARQFSQEQFRKQLLAVYQQVIDSTI